MRLSEAMARVYCDDRVKPEYVREVRTHMCRTNHVSYELRVRLAVPPSDACATHSTLSPLPLVPASHRPRSCSARPSLRLNKATRCLKTTPSPPTHVSSARTARGGRRPWSPLPASPACQPCLQALQALPARPARLRGRLGGPAGLSAACRPCLPSTRVTRPFAPAPPLHASARCRLRPGPHPAAHPLAHSRTSALTASWPAAGGGQAGAADGAAAAGDGPPGAEVADGDGENDENDENDENAPPSENGAAAVGSKRG